MEQAPARRYRFFATTARGLEPTLCHELKSLKCASVKSTNGGAFFEGDLSDALAACLWLRSAFRVTLCLLDAPCHDYDDLYDLAATIPWQDHIKRGQTLAVDATCVRSPLSHSHLAALKVKDAVVDVLRDQTGARPDVDTRAPDLKVMVWLLDTRCVMGVDLCGDPLFMRKYRVAQTEAPLKESLGAGLLLMTRWNAHLPLRDPMCGSGTLAIEAALLGLDRAPGRHRPFTFQRHPLFDSTLSRHWRGLLEDADARIKPASTVQIVASDHNPEALQAAQANAQAAGVLDAIRFELADIRSLAPGYDAGMLLSNPPYGARLGGSNSSVEMLYRMLGQQLKGVLESSAWFFCANPRFESCLGLPAASRHKLYNGPLETWFYEFHLGGRGSKRNTKPSSHKR